MSSAVLHGSLSACLAVGSRTSGRQAFAVSSVTVAGRKMSPTARRRIHRPAVKQAGRSAGIGGCLLIKVSRTPSRCRGTSGACQHSIVGWRSPLRGSCRHRAAARTVNTPTFSQHPRRQRVEFNTPVPRPLTRSRRPLVPASRQAGFAASHRPSVRSVSPLKCGVGRTAGVQ